MFEYRNLDWDTATDVPVDPVVINTWYTALAVTRNVKVYYLIVEQTNTGASNEDWELEITHDGTVTVCTGAGIGSGDVAYVYFLPDGTATPIVQVRQILSLDPDQSAPLETRSLGIRVRQTSAVDITSAIIEVNMVYETLEAA